MSYLRFSKVDNPLPDRLLVQSDWFDKCWAVMYTQHMLNSCRQTEDNMSVLNTT